MKAEQLRKAILQMAIQGKLVPQDPNDEPASVLLEKIRAEKQKLIKEGKIKKDKVDSVIFRGEDNRHYEKVGNEVREITDEIDFELPGGWELVRLSTICWLDDIKQSSGEKLPYLDAKTLRGKGEKTFLTNGKIVDTGTKVILVDGENSGEVFDIPYRGYMGSTFKILKACDNFDLQYLNMVLNFYRDMFRGNKIGAAIPHLNKTIFRELLIGLPPLAEQSRIVAEIEKYEPLIAEYDKLEQQKSKLDGEIYDKLKKSILQYAIQGKLVPQEENDEPASELLKRIRAEKKAQLGKKYVDSYIYKGDDNCYYEHIDGKVHGTGIEVPFDLPDSWGWARIKYISEVKGGKRIPAGRSLIDKNNGHIYIRVTDMQNETILTDKLKYVPEDILPIIKNYTISKEDLYLTIAGTIGRVGVVPELFDNMNLTENAVKLCNILVGKTYLLKALQSQYVQQLFTERTNKVAQPKLAIERILSCLIPIPPLAEQQRIVDILNKIFAKL